MRLPRFRTAKAATAAAPAAPAQASVDAYDVAHWFNYTWATDQEDFTEESTYWWWVVSVRLDPDEVWMEADDGTLWVIPFSTDGETDITVTGDPQRSRLVAVPVSAADGATASAAVDRRRQRLLATYHERPDKPQPTAAERPDNEEDDPVRINIAALRQRLGISATELPDDATEEQINTALATEEAPPEETQPDEPGTTDGRAPGSEEEHPPDEQPSAPLDQAATTAATVPPAGTVVVDEERLARLEADAAARRNEDRDRVIDAAITDGRFMPSRRDHYVAAWDADPEGTRHLLTADAADGGLAKNTVPVHQRATSTQTDAGYDRVRASMGLKARKES